MHHPPSLVGRHIPGGTCAVSVWVAPAASSPSGIPGGTHAASVWVATAGLPPGIPNGARPPCGIPGGTRVESPSGIPNGARVESPPGIPNEAHAPPSRIPGGTRVASVWVAAATAPVLTRGVNPTCIKRKKVNMYAYTYK